MKFGTDIDGDCFLTFFSSVTMGFAFVVFGEMFQKHATKLGRYIYVPCNILQASRSLAQWNKLCQDLGTHFC